MEKYTEEEIRGGMALWAIEAFETKEECYAISSDYSDEAEYVNDTGDIIIDFIKQYIKIQENGTL